MNQKDPQKGIAHILLLILLVAGIILGIYLVQNRTNIFPRAVSEPIVPETSFSLESNTKSVKVGGTFTADVFVRSDFDAANTFSALISYPADKLEVVGIEPLIFTTQGMSEPANPILADGNSLNSVMGKIIPPAQAQTPMPALSGTSICIENAPRVALSWNSDLNPDVLNWDIFREPPFAGSQQVFVGNYTLPFNTPKVGRIEYPLLAQGDAGGTYTYYLEGAAGQSNKVTVTNNATCLNNSQLVEAVVPAQIQPGAQFNVKYVFKNTGTRVWPSSSFSFIYGPEVDLKLISNSPFSPVSNELKKTSNGINLSVYPGQTYTFEFPVTAPANAGIYDFGWQMSYKGTNFGAASKKQIIVGAGASSPSPPPSQAPSQTPNPPAACGLLCGSDSICAGAKDGCTSCLPADNGTQKICKPPAPINLNFFIKKWIEQTDDKQGRITLVGAVPNPGFKTSNGQKGLMVRITFKAKAIGELGLDFIKDGTAIYRNSDNQNILTVARGTKVLVGGVESSSIPTPSPGECRAIGCASPPIGCNYQNGFTSTCNPAEYDKLTCGNLICVSSPSPSSIPPIVNGKRADLYKDPKKPNFVNDQDISVFYSKCAEKGVELFGQPASVQPICDIFEDGKITVSDWAVLIKFRNSSI